MQAISPTHYATVEHSGGQHAPSAHCSENLITVIGRGRSGTRLMAHTLRHSGVYMGAQLNPSGSGDLVPAEDLYEACRIMSRHVVYQGQLQWDFSPLHEMPIDEQFIRCVESYLQSVLADGSPYRGWKLPETTLFCANRVW